MCVSVARSRRRSPGKVICGFKLARLKEWQAAARGAGQYELLADNAADVHENLINRLGVRTGERWLDLATGTGAIRAARKSAIVTGQDFADGLIDTAKRLATDAGVEVRFEIGDCERLPTPMDRSTWSAQPSVPCSHLTTSR